MGPGLFNDFGGLQFQNVFYDIFRAGVLFHEARHSDGHGKTLGFMHAKCPATHDLAGLNACDAATNGPYTIGSEMHKYLMYACGSSCSELTMKALQVLYADQSSRTLESWQYPSASPGARAGTDWDDAPETVPQDPAPAAEPVK